MGEPKSIVIEYADGTTKRADFSRLSRQGRLDLSGLGLCAPPSVIREPAKHYVVFLWKDGWKEVVGIEKNVVDLLRYYTIERTEKIGRMALDVAEDNPELIVIKRLPDQIGNVLIIGTGDKQSFVLEENISKREGGKTEQFFYDSKELGSECEKTGDTDGLIAEMMKTLQSELTDRQLTSEKLLSDDESEKAVIYKEIAKALGIRGMKEMEDVYGFIEMMLVSI